MGNRLERQMLDFVRKAFADQPAHVPAGGSLAWRWFLDLCRTRTSNGYGPNPISYAEIESYARLYRWPLEGRHVDLILALDRAWLSHSRPETTEAARPNFAPGQTMTPDAFDAVFG